MKQVSFDLESRLVQFAVSITQLVVALPKSSVARHLGGQLTRSGTSPALNYGEAQAAESTDDFIHKMKICLKELRESQINLRILQMGSLAKPEEIASVLDECGQLVAIFTSSVRTASQKRDQSKKEQ